LSDWGERMPKVINCNSVRKVSRIILTVLLLSILFSSYPLDLGNANKWEAIGTLPAYTIANNEMHMLLNGSTFQIATRNDASGRIQNFVADMEFKMDADNGYSYYGFCVRNDLNGNYYRIAYSQYALGGYQKGINIVKFNNYAVTERATAYNVTLNTNQYYKLEVEAKDNTFSAYLDGVLVVSYTDNNPTTITGQRISIWAYDRPAWIKNIVVNDLVDSQAWLPINTKPEMIKNSAMDLSFTNDRPAGNKGFIKIDANSDYFFENEPTKKIKFYGTNLNGTNVAAATPEESIKMADRIASMGYNLVRIHSGDTMESWAQGIFDKPTSTTIQLNATALDNVDYFIYQLKERGIYVNIDIITLANFESVASLSGYGIPSTYITQLFPDGMTLWKDMANKWLKHKNPYTGLALNSDPVLVGVCPWNESILFNISKYNTKLKEYFMTDFNAFLTRKGRTNIADITTIPDSFWVATNTAPYYIANNLIEYFTEKTVTSYNIMKTYLNVDLEVKAPIGGLNCINDYATTYWRTKADTHETHLYNSIVDGRGTSFTYTPGAAPRYSMIFDPISKTNYVPKGGSPYFGGYVPILALGQLYNKPFDLTEFNQEWPTDGRDDIGIFTAAAGAYNGWDMLQRFDFTVFPTSVIGDKVLGGFSSFNTVTDIICIASEYQGDLIYRKGEITPAIPRFVLVRDKTYSQTNSSATTADYSDYNMSYLPHLFKMVTVYADNPGVSRAVYKITDNVTPEKIASGVLKPADIPASNKINITTTATTDSGKRKQIAQAFINSLDDPNLKTTMLSNINKNLLVSDTGELTFDLNNNIYLVNTPYVASIAGTMNRNTYTLGKVKLKGNSDKGTMTVGALDKKTLDESERILILYTTDAMATGETKIPVPSSKDVTYTKGTLPTLIKESTGEVELTTKLRPSSFVAYKLDMNGNRLGKLPISYFGSTIKVQLQVDSGFSFELVSEGINFNRNGINVYNFSEVSSGDIVTANVNFSNDANGAYSQFFALGLYKDNMLKGVKSTIVASTAQDKMINVSLDMKLPTGDISGYYMKAFMWNNAQSFMPILENGVLN